MRDQLAGRVALMTGASRGIGAATARELADHGIAVTLAARGVEDIDRVAAEIRRGGGIASAIPCDVSRYADVKSAVDACREAHGRIDILVNNAGVIDPIARLGDSDPEAWCRVADINYKGVYHGLRAVIPAMEPRGSAVVANISSGAASRTPEGQPASLTRPREEWHKHMK